MAEGNERSASPTAAAIGYGDRRPGNRGGKGFKPRGKGGFKPRHDGEVFKPRRREDGEGLRRVAMVMVKVAAATASRTARAHFTRVVVPATAAWSAS
ncbi:MAG: hypothetical protein ACLT4Y_08410 [Bifidobacterium breve]